jgi:hypothetical protein
MSAATVFRPGGNLYDVIDRAIDLLPKHLRHAALTVFRFLVRTELLASLAAEKPTDADIATAMGIAPRTVQKGLNALEAQAAKVPEIGRPLIERQSGLGCHGRRTITLTVGLAPSGSRRSAEASPPVPPQSPPEREGNTTTEGTGGRSSSSPEKAPEETPEPTPPPPPELVKRAQELIPGTTPGQVTEALADGYTPAEVDRALDEVPEHNRKPGNLRVKGWGWIRRTLANFRKQGGAPPQREPRPPAPPARKAPEPEAPLPQLLPAELAALIAQAREGPIPLRRLAVGQIRRALHDGAIAAELIPTIPGEILAGSEVPAGGSA